MIKCACKIITLPYENPGCEVAKHVNNTGRFVIRMGTPV